jgi:glutathione reductase (NADPH)
MLVSSSEAIDAARRMRGHGVDGDLRIDWRELMTLKRSLTDPVPAKQEQHYRHRRAHSNNARIPVDPMWMK